MDLPSHLSLKIPETNLPRIVIVGGGFAGLNLAKKLRQVKAQIVMIDRNNFHTFQPLLYQVATAGLEPDSIAGPLRKTFEKQKNFFERNSYKRSRNDSIPFISIQLIYTI